MNTKLKKIIAREGLIILLIILLGIATRILPNPIVLSEKERPVDLLTEKKIKVTDDSTGIKYYTIVKKDFDPFDKVEAENQITKFLKTAEIVKKEIVDLNNKLLFIVLSIYPLYWLIRFILWAIKTLKEKPR